MSIVKIVKKIEVDDYREFCNVFDIQSSNVAGYNGTDEELIIKELDKILNEKWIVNFIDNRSDGFFRLQMLE